jgi:hypothetical protein
MIKLPTPNKPRILFLCDHETFQLEECHLLVDAGCEVIVPIMNSKKSALYGQTSLPPNIIENLKNLDFTINFPACKYLNPFSDKEKELINSYINIIFVTAIITEVPNLLAWFKGFVVFRAFGHGGLTSYTNICLELGADLNSFRHERYYWCPIADTLNEEEDSRILNNFATSIIQSITPTRLPCWQKTNSTSYCCNVLSKIMLKPYYNDLYIKQRELFKDIPTKIFGKNFFQQAVTTDNCVEVTGFLESKDYYEQLSLCRVMFYHTSNPYHLHHYPQEALAMGIPVLFHTESIIAYEARKIISPPINKLGCYKNTEEALILVKKCLTDLVFALKLSEEQKILTELVFSKKRALKNVHNLLTAMKTHSNT